MQCLTKITAAAALVLSVAPASAGSLSDLCHKIGSAAEITMEGRQNGVLITVPASLASNQDYDAETRVLLLQIIGAAYSVPIYADPELRALAPILFGQAVTETCLGEGA